MGGTLIKVDIGHGRGWASPTAAASILRIDAQLGRVADINEAGRSPEQADKNHRAWLAYLAGGPKAPYALPASQSVHCWGDAADSDDWYDPAAAAVWRDNGWRQTARYFDRNGRPTAKDEPWHGEHFPDLDNHRNDPAPTPGAEIQKPKEDEMMFIGNSEDGYKLVDELGADDWAQYTFVQSGATFGDNLAAARILAEKEDVEGGWKLSLVRHIANARWDQKRGQIVTDVVASLKPLFAEIAQAVAGISPERFAELIEKGLADVVVPPAEISDADKEEIAKLTREEFRENPLT